MDQATAILSKDLQGVFSNPQFHRVWSKLNRQPKLQRSTLRDELNRIGAVMNKLKADQWKEFYEAALLEFDPTRLTRLVAFAETAIFFRLQSLSRGPEAQEERRAIEDAINALYTIKKEKLKFPGLDFDPSSRSQESSGLD